MYAFTNLSHRAVRIYAIIVSSAAAAAYVCGGTANFVYAKLYSTEFRLHINGEDPSDAVSARKLEVKLDRNPVQELSAPGLKTKITTMIRTLNKNGSSSKLTQISICFDEDGRHYCRPWQNVGDGGADTPTNEFVFTTPLPNHKLETSFDVLMRALGKTKPST